MRILFVVPYTPSLIYVRPYNLIRHLAAAGHDVTVLCLYGSEKERENAEVLRDDGVRVLAQALPRWRALWNVLATVPTRKPLQAAYAWQPALAKQLGSLVDGMTNGEGKFDVLHVEHLRGARYGLWATGRMSGRGAAYPLPVVWDSVDCISLLFERAAAKSRSIFGRWVTRFDLARTRRYEAWLARQFDHILMTSPADREALRDLAGMGEQDVPITVLHNGVDLDYFRPGPAAARQEARLVVSGKMSYHANVTMTLYLVQAIMPIVWARRPDARLTIAGKDPGRAIRDLAIDPRIQVTGTVPDVRPYLQQATVAVAPIQYGVGIQNKVLEAMACGAPVVATPQAVSALSTVPGRDLLTAANPEAFAEAIVGLVADRERRETVAAAGRAYVETHHRWAKIASRLESVYQQAIESHRGGASV